MKVIYIYIFFFLISRDKNDLPENFDQNLLSSITNINTLRRFSVKRKGDGTKHPSKKQKRGPKVATVKIKPYHLPPGSAKPRFNNFSCTTVKRHVENGYGLYR